MPTVDRRRLAARAYACVLAAYPREFRRDFGDQMVAAFDELARIAAREPVHGRILRLLAVASFDVVRSAVAMRWEALRRRVLGPRDRLEVLAGADTSWKERVVGGIDRLAFDLRGTVRGLSKAPGYTAAAILTLALGIGANTAIFSLVHGILLRPLPFADSERLVLLRQLSAPLDNANVGFSVQEVNAYREAATIEALVEYHDMDFVLLGGDRPERVSAGIVSWQFFDFLGVPALHGRLLEPTDESVTAAPIVVFSHDYWQRSHGGDPGVVGRQFVLNDRLHTVAGVLPPVPQYPRRHDIYMPVTACPIRSSRGFIDDPSRRMMGLVARMRVGADAAAVNRDMAGVSSALSSAIPEAFPEALALRQSAVGMREELTRQARPRLLVLLAATGLVLISACANVASLALARSLRRRREIALRAALGAGRGRLIRLRVLETLALSGAGGILGVALAIQGRGPLVDFAARYTTRAAEVQIDARVLAFAVALSLASGLAAGLAPALPFGRGMFAALREGNVESTSGRRTQRIRRGLIAAEVAASVVLLVAAGLTLRSFSNLSRVDPGLRLANVVATSLHFNPADYRGDDDVRRFTERLVAQVGASPGVAAVAVATGIPLTGRPFQVQVEILDRADAATRASRVGVHGVSAGYFDVTGIGLLAGRFPAPDEFARPARVGVISQTMAALNWPGKDPIGDRLSFALGDGELEIEIVGVAASVRSQGLDVEPGPEIYLPANLIGIARDLLVRVDGDPAAVAEQIVHTVQALDPDMPLTGPYRLEARRSEAMASPRLIAVLLSLFAILALIVAITGITGLIGYVVSARTREIGLRVALGAEPLSVARLLLGHGLGPAAWGLAAGSSIAFAMSSTLGALLFEVARVDPMTYLGVAALILLAAMVACLGPARQALRISPHDALRAQ